MQNAENQLKEIKMKKMSDTVVIPKDQKIFSMRELKSKGFSQYRVSKLINEGKLIKLNKSYYENVEYHVEKSDFYYTEVYAPKGVVCLLSAAVYYHLTTFIPDVIDVAISRKARVSTQWHSNRAVQNWNFVNRLNCFCLFRKYLSRNKHFKQGVAYE